jgi:hypothetical protein
MRALNYHFRSERLQFRNALYVRLVSVETITIKCQPWRKSAGNDDGRYSRLPLESLRLLSHTLQGCLEEYFISAVLQAPGSENNNGRDIPNTFGCWRCVFLNFVFIRTFMSRHSFLIVPCTKNCRRISEIHNSYLLCSIIP